MVQTANSKWYESKWLVILLLIVFFPVGLYVLWRKSQFSTKTKVILTAVVVMSLLALSQSEDGQIKKTVSVKGGSLQDQPSLITAELQNDADYQEWLRIDRRTKPFTKDKDWIKGVFQYMRGPNKKWNLVKDERIFRYINKVYGENGVQPFRSDKQLYGKTKYQLNMLKYDFEKRIVDSALCKQAVPLPISLESVGSLAKASGFCKEIHRNSSTSHYWTDHKYYMDHEVIRGKTKGKGQHFEAIADQHGNIVEITIPLGKKAQIDWDTLPDDDPNATYKFCRHYLREVCSNPPLWVSSSLDLIFGKESQIVARKIAEVGKADDAELKRMVSKSSRLPACEMEFSIGNKNTMILFLWIGRPIMRVTTNETLKLWDTVDKLDRLRLQTLHRIQRFAFL